VLEEARAVEGIGRCHLRNNRPDKASAMLREARAIYVRLGSPAAEQIAELLRDHNL